MDILCEINPEYKKHVRTKYGRKNLYILILKAIYGMIDSALLWYELYVSVLKDVVFQLSTYYFCVDNKDINGKQCNIAWYKDKNKVSHVEQEVIDDVINKVEGRFTVLTVTEVNTYTFLLIKTRYLNNSMVANNMKEYILEAAQEFGEDFLRC